MPHSSYAKTKRIYRRRLERRCEFVPEEFQQQMSFPGETVLQYFWSWVFRPLLRIFIMAVIVIRIVIGTFCETVLQCFWSWVFRPLLRIFIMTILRILIRIYWKENRDYLKMMDQLRCEMQRQNLVAAIEGERQNQLGQQELSDDATGVPGLFEESRCCRLLKEIDGVSLTTDDGQPDVITLDSSTEHTRAIMPCGHVIGPQSLYDYCFFGVLPGGNVDIVCPVDGCNAIWNYAAVRHVASLSIAEMEDLETRLTLNYLRHKVGYQQCKGCETWCCRADPDKISCSTVSCPICTERQGREYSFCWGCLEECNDDLVNGGCVCEDTTQNVQQQLRECPEKQLIQCGVMCPSVRACPKCAALLEHKDQCQHLQCRSCFHWFCFICLHPSGCHCDNVESRDACRAPYACQQVAHRQT